MIEPKIPGGYVLLSRKLIDSEIFKKPPLYLKVWIYLLQRAQHGDFKQLKRGQVRTSIPEIMEACSWFSGYRKEKPTKDQKKMEELTKRYGTKNFVLDNLMMIDLECSEYELNKKQKEFVLSLKSFARKFNAVVHLIAHPRKTDIIRRLTKLDVAGSGDITNLADYVLSIHRVTQEEKEDKYSKRGDVIVPACPYDNMLDLFKNRPLGHQDKTIGLYFHYPSRRLYGASDNINRKYSWIKMWKPKLEGAVEVEVLEGFGE